MTEHKFTDEEVIRALGICAQNTVGREGYFTYQGIPLRYLCEDALGLINRQKAEIEILTKDRYIITPDGRYELLPRTDINKIRAEAITEFADRLKTYYSHLDRTAGGLVEYHIDQVVKETLEGG